VSSKNKSKTSLEEREIERETAATKFRKFFWHIRGEKGLRQNESV
jgi:hypothetical protein